MFLYISDVYAELEVECKLYKYLMTRTHGYIVFRGVGCGNVLGINNSTTVLFTIDTASLLMNDFKTT
jgi:hypothetical protein